MLVDTPMSSPSSSSSSASTASSSSSSMTSVSSSTSSVHKASLVDPSRHSPALLELLEVKISRPFLQYVVDCVADTVDYAMGRPSPNPASGAPQRDTTAFTTFVKNVLSRAEVTTPVVLAALVYIDRAKPHLHIALEEWARERVFLGAIIVASKYLNDSTLKNIHWALCTGVFGKRDIGRIEREFLDVLDFQLGIAEDDILAHHDAISAAVATPVASTSAPAKLNAENIPHRHRRRHEPAPQQQTHHHHQSVSTIAIPDLSPASTHSIPFSTSTSSSSSSSSPSTPGSLDSPEISVRMTSPTHSQPPQRPKKSSFHLTASTMDLLRSFPVPLPARMHHKEESTRGRKSYKGLPVMPPVLAA